MYTEIEYELNYTVECLHYVIDETGFVKMHINKLLSEMAVIK